MKRKNPKGLGYITRSHTDYMRRLFQQRSPRLGDLRAELDAGRCTAAFGILSALVHDDGARRCHTDPLDPAERQRWIERYKDDARVSHELIKRFGEECICKR